MVDGCLPHVGLRRAPPLRFYTALPVRVCVCACVPAALVGRTAALGALGFGARGWRLGVGVEGVGYGDVV